MALVEANTILSYEQEVTDTTYSQRYIDLKAQADYGVGRPLYFVFNILGAFTKDLRAQVVGFTDDSLSDPVVLADSGIHEQASLVAGVQFSVQVNQVDKKYKVIALRYIPSAAGTGEEHSSVSGDGTIPDVSNFAPPVKVGEENKEIANGVTAFAALTVPTKLLYQYVNHDKATV